MSHSFPLRALFYLSLNIVFWAVGPLFVKHFTQYYDAWTQNAFRYSSAAVMLLVVAKVRRWPLGELTRAQWGKLLAAAAANVLLQVAFALAYYFIYPSIASIVMRIDILIVCVLSFIFFHDERRVVRTPGFLAGAGLALFGLFTVVTAQDPEILERLEVSQARFWIGIGLIVTYAFFLGIYSLAIKRLVRDVNPLVSFTHVSWITALCLSILMFVMGRPSDLLQAGTLRPMLLMVLSALCCIIIAHTALYAALREIKAVVSTTLMLLTPVVTCTLSAFIYNDSLSAGQIVGGLGVLAGAWLAANAQARAARESRGQ